MNFKDGHYKDIDLGESLIKTENMECISLCRKLD